MKRVITNLFPTGAYISDAAGAVRTYEMDEGLVEVLGQAASMRVHGYVWERTDATARATLRFFESSVDGDVQDKGAQIGAAIDLSAMGPTFSTVSGTFCGRVFARLEIDDSAATNQKRFEMEVGVTLIIED
jgi:hypothetical protein